MVLARRRIRRPLSGTAERAGQPGGADSPDRLEHQRRSTHLPGRHRPGPRTEEQMSVAEDDVRHIEAEAAPTRYARGWHCLGLERDFRDGKPHQVKAFGQKLVVFAGEDGSVNVLDAYCRHMGGDLSQGTVKGNEIACPFHDWRWGGDGRCKQIPYARRVPLRARTATWPTLVQDGMLFVWNDPEGNPPPAEVTIPRIEG